jgi:phosphoribosylanthranilate isomerase
MTRIKICGITNPDDALLAANAGADAIGLVFADSPRRVSPAAAAHIIHTLPPLVTVIGVFLNARNEDITTTIRNADLDAVQLHGQEPPGDCERLPGKVIKRFNILENDTPDTLRERMQRYRVAAHLLDPGAGSGQTFDWTIARGLPGPLIISGGLAPQNVGDAISIVRPYAVDVSSGVESKPGQKDPAKVKAFVQAVRDADARIDHD